MSNSTTAMGDYDYVLPSSFVGTNMVNRFVNGDLNPRNNDEDKFKNITGTTEYGQRSEGSQFGNPGLYTSLSVVDLHSYFDQRPIGFDVSSREGQILNRALPELPPTTSLYHQPPESSRTQDLSRLKRFSKLCKTKTFRIIFGLVLLFLFYVLSSAIYGLTMGKEE